MIDDYTRGKYAEACGWDELQAETDRWMRGRKLKPSEDPRVIEALRVARETPAEALGWWALCNRSRRTEPAS